MIATEPFATAVHSGADTRPRLKEVNEAIPPAYTEWIGTQLLAHLGVST